LDSDEWQSAGRKSSPQGTDSDGTPPNTLALDPASAERNIGEVVRICALLRPTPLHMTPRMQSVICTDAVV
jgi:hypothetical protein